VGKITLTYQDDLNNIVNQYKFVVDYPDEDWIDEKLAILADIALAFVSQYEKEFKGELEEM